MFAPRAFSRTGAAGRSTPAPTSGDRRWDRSGPSPASLAKTLGARGDAVNRPRWAFSEPGVKEASSCSNSPTTPPLSRGALQRCIRSSIDIDGCRPNLIPRTCPSARRTHRPGVVMLATGRKDIRLKNCSIRRVRQRVPLFISISKSARAIYRTLRRTARRSSHPTWLVESS